MFFFFRYPDKNQVLCSEGRCTIAILISYILPVVLCSPTYTMFVIANSTHTIDGVNEEIYYIDLNENVQNDTTMLLINFWLYSVLIKLLPCTILTIITCWLIRTLVQAKKRKQVLKSYDSCPKSSSAREGRKKISSKQERMANRTTKMLIAVLVLFLITEFPQGIFSFFIGLKGERLFLDCYQRYGEIMDMMALLNGSINFILYCSMNRMFRTTFRHLFGSKILGKLVVSASDVHTT